MINFSGVPSHWILTANSLILLPCKEILNNDKLIVILIY